MELDRRKGSLKDHVKVFDELGLSIRTREGLPEKSSRTWLSFYVPAWSCSDFTYTSLLEDTAARQ